MRLLATVVASAVSQGFGDYDLFNSYGAPNTEYGKFGTVTGGATGGNNGIRSGNGRFCHATKDSIAIHRWDVSKNGFFNHYNKVECQGEEFYCFLEERAHFGQVIGIRAGCAQMMNHPQVKRTRLTEQRSLNNNREAFRERTFKNSGGSDYVLGYGVGGCVAMQAQNHKDQLDSGFDANVEDNMFFYGSWYQGQCLRHISRDDAGWKDLLPFGVSVCRSCCVAGTATESDYHEDTGASAVCNFLPFKQPARGGEKNEHPHIPFGYDFECIEGYEQGVAVAAASHEFVGTKTKGTTISKPDFTTANAAGAGSCSSNCNPNMAGQVLPDEVKAAAGGVTFHDATTVPGTVDSDKIRHYSCNDNFAQTRGTCQPIPNAPNGDFAPATHYACTDDEWYDKPADSICDGDLDGAVECYPKTFTEADKLTSGASYTSLSNAFSFANHDWVDASDCDVCLNEIVPRFDAVDFDTATRVNLFMKSCNSDKKRCDPSAKTVIDMQVLYTP